MQAAQQHITTAALTDRILIRTMADAVLIALGQKKGQKFLRAWADGLVAEQEAKKIVPILGKQAEGLDDARDEAVRWFSAELPKMVGAVCNGR